MPNRRRSYAIIPAIFVLLSIFAVNMVLQYKNIGPWTNYLFGESMYIILSLLAKTVLVWHFATLIVQIGLSKKAPAGFVTAGAFCM